MGGGAEGRPEGIAGRRKEKHFGTSLGFRGFGILGFRDFGVSGFRVWGFRFWSFGCFYWREHGQTSKNTQKFQTSVPKSMFFLGGSGG